MATTPEEVLRLWGESAAYWEKHRQTISVIFRPATGALVEEACIGLGNNVLDVGGGIGEPSLFIASRVGESGTVCCTDPVGPMVGAARREARRLGLRNMRFCQCLADGLPFADAVFDAAVCRFGIMFFPDPLLGVREMSRVVAAGGRVSFAVWSTSEANPFHSAITPILARYVESPPADPDAPGPFRFAARGKLASVLSDAGLSEVKERVVQFFIDAPLSAAQFWELRSEMSDTIREKLARLSADQIRNLKTEVLHAVEGFFSKGHMCFAAEILVVTGNVH